MAGWFGNPWFCHHRASRVPCLPISPRQALGASPLTDSFASCPPRSGAEPSQTWHALIFFNVVDGLVWFFIFHIFQGYTMTQKEAFSCNDLAHPGGSFLWSSVGQLYLKQSRFSSHSISISVLGGYHTQFLSIIIQFKSWQFVAWIMTFHPLSSNILQLFDTS